MKVFSNSCSIYYFIFTIIFDVFSFLGFIVLMFIAISQIGGCGLFTSNNAFFMVLAPWIWNNNINIYILYCIGTIRRFYVVILIMRIIMIVLIAITSVITLFSSNNPLPIVINIFYIVVIILEYKLFKQVQKPEEKREYFIVQNATLTIS